MSCARTGKWILAALVFAIAIGPHFSNAPTPVRATDGDPVLGDWAVELLPREGPALADPGAALLDGTTDVPAALARPKTVEITVTYHDFPAAAQTAFEAAVAIWETLLKSDAEILITANWTPLEGLLAQTRSTFRSKDPVEDPDLPFADTLYPSALAEALRGHRIDEMADFEVDMSSAFEEWYFGTDSAPAVGKLDLETVALHELAHGFGMYTRATPDGFAGTNHTPTVFDHFIVSGAGTPIIGMSPAALASSLTSNELFFAGPKAKKTAGGRGAALYAPSPFVPGSSTSHLDLPEFLEALSDRLLGPTSFAGYALHDPGAVVMSILADTGWDVSGVGQPARFKFNLVSNFWVEGQGHPMDIRVNVLDPLGDPVPGDNTTSVSLHLFANLGGDDDPGWGCIGGIYTKKVTDGLAVFPGCYIRGTGMAYFKAVESGIADGWSPFIVVAKDVHRVRVPMVVR